MKYVFLVDKHQFDQICSLVLNYCTENVCAWKKKNYFVLFYIKNLPIWIKDIV